MPAQKPAESKQDYATPRPFIAACEQRFGVIEFDLAADESNTVVPGAYFDQRRDSLVQDWAALGAGLLWLNPPFGDIASFAKKCAEESQRGAHILFLTPASVGSDWFQQYVVPHAHVLELSPRISFDGKAPFPKDLILSVYMAGLTGRSFWRWKKVRQR
jgi:phage N-6-adenine-methyltransferase